jgi:hypothetical protein
VTGRTIYKYPLAITDQQTIEMPAGADILTAQFQYGTLCLWATVDTDNQLTPRHIRIIGTGNPIPDHTLAFIGTAQMPTASLVWHVFEDHGP